MPLRTRAGRNPRVKLSLGRSQCQWGIFTPGYFAAPLFEKPFVRKVRAGAPQLSSGRGTSDAEREPRLQCCTGRCRQGQRRLLHDTCLFLSLTSPCSWPAGASLCTGTELTMPAPCLWTDTGRERSKPFSLEIKVKGLLPPALGHFLASGEGDVQRASPPCCHLQISLGAASCWGAAREALARGQGKQERTQRRCPCSPSAQTHDVGERQKTTWEERTFAHTSAPRCLLGGSGNESRAPSPARCGAGAAAPFYC